MTSQKVRIVWHPSSQDHDPGPGHPESPERTRAVLAALREPAMADVTSWEEAGPAEPPALLRAHTPEYLSLLESVERRGGGRLDEDTVMSRHSYQAARHAAGGAIRAAKLALFGTPAFAATRPPGHHALPNAAMGFCLINNVVVAARAVMAEDGVERVLIVDWDVHHGNGTQAMVERDANIRYVSLHQWPLYPGTGRDDERGVGNIFNVPRPAGLPRATYVRDLNDAVTRATDGWKPDLLLISAGFDALAGDPLGAFPLEPEDFVSWLREWRTLGAPCASVLEGGYAPARVAEAAALHVRALA